MVRKNPLERLAEIEGLGARRRTSSSGYASSLMVRLAGAIGRFAPTYYRSRLRILIHKAGLRGESDPKKFSA